MITNAFEESETLPWLSTAEALANRDDQIPVELEMFLSYLLGGNPSHQSQSH